MTHRPSAWRHAWLCALCGVVCAACDAPKPPRLFPAKPPLVAPSTPRNDAPSTPLASPPPAASATPTPPPRPAHTLPPPPDPTREAFGLPLPKTPEPIKTQVENSYTFSFFTSLSVNAMEGFIRDTLPSHTITRFPTGALRASPPNNDGTEVSVTPSSLTQRLVTYRVVYPFDPNLAADLAPPPPEPDPAPIPSDLDEPSALIDPDAPPAPADTSPLPKTAY